LLDLLTFSLRLKSEGDGIGHMKITKKVRPTTAKVQSLEKNKSYGEGTTLTTNHGVALSDDQNSLKTSERGATLLEDFILREKITHFDHERIPERVVHARGTAAHGYFQSYKNHASLSRAHFLTHPNEKTPVFVRFSTVAGSRGSADTVRDVRGFAVKFYTQEGNYDLVGNNIPVFFIQDAIKFPDLIHAAKPEPHHEMPQAQTAHDTFWDFAGLTPESTHMLLWIMSDRTLPRSFAMMEGFGVHTFRLINADGVGRFVKFHWKPLLGTHALVWDEAQKLAGKDPDFHRRDLFEAIERGDFPEWELGVQIVEEKDEHSFDFDLLDPTKLIPEELVPVRPLGKMVLNRNTDNFFSETEQVAFCAAHVVPGIDFTNDPLLQGRLFSYTDTQLTRLGGPNFHEIPINQPVCPFSNNQRDGLHRQRIDVGRVAYGKNSLQGNTPLEAKPGVGFESYMERVDGKKIRARSKSFGDHFTQATLFWESQTGFEKDHIVEAFSFELSKCEIKTVRERVLQNLAEVHPDLVARVSANLGVKPPKAQKRKSSLSSTSGSQSGPANRKKKVLASSALSMYHPGQAKEVGAMGRKIAILVAEGVDGKQIAQVQAELSKAGVTALLLGHRMGPIEGLPNLEPHGTFAGMPSILFDGVFVPNGGKSLNFFRASGEVKHYIMEAYKHYKTIGIGSDVGDLLTAVNLSINAPGVITMKAGFPLKASHSTRSFVAALSLHRHWERLDTDSVPA
jgi:catalase